MAIFLTNIATAIFSINVTIGLYFGQLHKIWFGVFDITR